MKKVFMFPGQGSQKVGMGEELFSQFQNEIQQANKILGYDVVDYCLNDSEEKINQTQYTQPLLYLINAFSYLSYQNKNADIFIGHSLGEYNALQAVECFSLFDGLKMVQKRGDLMSKMEQGGMAALIGLDEETIKKVLAENNFDQIEIANYNSDAQIVLSGDKNQIENATETFKNAGAKRYIVLPVSGAFHSSFMKKASQEFSDFIQKFDFKKPVKEVYSNVKGDVYQQDDDIKEYLVKQIYSSVKWTHTIKKIKQQGESEFVEIGPGKVLTGLVNKIVAK